MNISSSQPGIYTTVIALFFLLPPAMAQEVPPRDSLRALSADSLRFTHRPSAFLPGIGNLLFQDDSTGLLNRRQTLYTDAMYAGDLLPGIPGVLFREMGTPGLPGQLHMTGTDGRGIAILLDGRPLHDPVFGMFNLYDLPSELIDEVEVLDPAGSLASAWNAPGGVLNIVTPQFNNNHPLTRIRFFQGPFEHILTDGTFSQNVSRGMNAMVGVQRHVSDGRYTNNAYDSWNVRARFRYNVSDRLNAWIDNIYSRSTVGLNSGVDPVQSPSLYNEVTAIVNAQHAYQITSRHDLTLGLTGTLLPDSASRSKALVYFTELEREYTLGGGAGFAPSFTSMQGSSFWGVLLEQRLTLTPFAVQAGAQAERRRADRSYFLPDHSEQYAAASLRTTVQLSEWLRGDFTARIEHLRSEEGLSWGVNVESNPVEWLTITAEHSRTSRFPTIQELSWSDTTFSRTGTISREQHTLSKLGLRLKHGESEVLISGFARTINDPLTFAMIPVSATASKVVLSAQPALSLVGASMQVRLQVWNFELTGSATWSDYEQSGSAPLLLPRFFASGELAYRDQFIGGALDLKAALRLRSMSKHYGPHYVPRMLVFAQQAVAQTGGFTILDFYTTAKIGSAYLTLSLQNPLNINAMMAPYYPLMNRNIRFGVNWTFID